MFDKDRLAAAGRTNHGESDRIYAAICSLRDKGYAVKRSGHKFSLITVRKVTTRDELVAFAAIAPDLTRHA